MQISGCDRQKEEKGHDYTPIDFFEQCQDYDFVINPLSYNELPGTGVSLSFAADMSFPRDDDGVKMYEYNDRYYYHAVSMCHKAMDLLDAYHQTKDTVWLEQVKKYVRRLVVEASLIDGALYYPCRFDFKVHARDDALLRAPWYSGMAQGTVLSVLVRMFNATRDSTYLDFAHKTFKSFQRLRGEAEPWTVFVDSRGCYWVEEYPLSEPSMTLNGFIAAIYGLYEYHQLIKSDSSEKILKASFNTIKNYVPLFRRRGKPSLYNLRFRHYAADYHKLHIEMLLYLEQMTNDSFFGKWADTLLADYNK